MFGNLQGWIASLIIAALTGGLIYAKGRPEEISKPTGGLTVAMAPLALTPDPKTLVPPGTKEGDAGEIYRELAAAVKSKEQEYQAFHKADGPKKRAAIKPLEPDMDLLIRAGECARMDLFKKNPGEVVNYANSRPILPELQQAGNTAVNVAVFWLLPDPNAKGKAKSAGSDKGQKLLEAVFHLGRFLAEERMVFDEYRVGIELMRNAASTLAHPKYGKAGADQKAALEAFAQGADLTQYTSVVQTITGIPSEGARVSMPGDIFEIARNGREPMWRTEAVLKLGRMRWMAGVRYGDQKGANRVLKELADRTDLPPNVKAAATAARDLTVERFRMIGGGA